MDAGAEGLREPWMGDYSMDPVSKEYLKLHAAIIKGEKNEYSLDRMSAAS